MEKIIDLRSDTVTRPTPEMREAMKNAIVGDDILRDDPTVIRLEELGCGDFRKRSGTPDDLRDDEQRDCGHGLCETGR